MNSSHPPNKGDINPSSAPIVFFENKEHNRGEGNAMVEPIEFIPIEFAADRERNLGNRHFGGMEPLVFPHGFREAINPEYLYRAVPSNSPGSIDAQQATEVPSLPQQIVPPISKKPMPQAPAELTPQGEALSGPVLDKPKLRVPNGADIASAIAATGDFRIWKDRIYVYRDGWYDLPSEADLNRVIRDFCQDAIDKNGRKGIFPDVTTHLLARSSLLVEPADLTQWVCLVNGIYSLKDGSLRSHSRKYFFTTRLEVTFMPGQNSTPLFDSFLYQSMDGDPKLIERAWQIFGYLLTGDMSAKAFFLLQGVSNSGKSVFLEVVKAMYQESAISTLDLFRLGERFSTSTLIGRALNVSGDLPNRPLSAQAVATLKMLTGRDEITIEEKYKPVAKLTPSVKFVFASNYALQLTVHDEAFLQRLIVLPFDIAIPKERQDTALTQKILTEKSGIFAKAIEAYRRLVRDNYVFAGQDVVTTSRYLQMSAPVSAMETVEQFVDCCCSLDDPAAYVRTSELYAAYNAFCQGEQLQSVIPTIERFSHLLKKHCGDCITNTKKRIGKKTANVYAGVSLL